MALAGGEDGAPWAERTSLTRRSRRPTRSRTISCAIRSHSTRTCGRRARSSGSSATESGPWPATPRCTRRSGTGRRSAPRQASGSVISARRSRGARPACCLRQTRRSTPGRARRWPEHYHRARCGPCAWTSPGRRGIWSASSWPATAWTGCTTSPRRSRCGCSRWPWG